MIFFFWTEIFPKNVFIIIAFPFITIVNIALFVLKFLNLPQRCFDKGKNQKKTNKTNNNNKKF